MDEQTIKRLGIDVTLKPGTILYRYAPSRYSLMSIEAKRFRVSGLSTLNDPFDSRVCVWDDLAAGHDVCSKVNSEVNGLRRSNYGIVCFSETEKEPLLWSHYADCHRGIVVGFNGDHMEALWKVKYTNKRPSIPLSVLRDASRKQEVLDCFMKTVFYKSEHWSYESERRVLIDLDQCKIEQGEYFRVFDPRIVASVILGLRCDRSIADVARTLRQSGCVDARIFRVVERSDSYEFGIEAV